MSTQRKLIVVSNPPSSWRTIHAQAVTRSVGPPLLVKEEGVMYPMRDSSAEQVDVVGDVRDADAADESGFYPELPFEVGEDFLEEIRKYLVEEEGMDEKDEQQLTIAIMRMAEDLCEMSMADEDAALDDEIVTDMIDRMTPYVEAQEKWEEDQAKQNSEKNQDSDAADTEADVPWVDEVGGWNTPGVNCPRSLFPTARHCQVVDSVNCCLCLAAGMSLPENVSRESIATILQWDKECEETREGPRASMGWQENRGALHPSVAADIMGLKSWKLGMKVHPKLAELAANIEAAWRQLFPMDLGRTHVDPRWRFVDSVDPNQVWGLDFGTEDPKLGSPQYPRLVLENRFYQTTKFRCLHLEIGLRQDGFQVGKAGLAYCADLVFTSSTLYLIQTLTVRSVQVLHCVMWPRRDHDIPILGFDVVAIGSDVTYAIADTTSVTADGSLPPVYVDGVRLLKAQFADGIADAGLPEWGVKLFSDEVVALRPALPVEADLICMHFTALLKVHILYSKFVDTKVADGDHENLERIDQTHRRHVYHSDRMCPCVFACVHTLCCVRVGGWRLSYMLQIL